MTVTGTMGVEEGNEHLDVIHISLQDKMKKIQNQQILNQ